jgi:hypothetical protein
MPESVFHSDPFTRQTPSSTNSRHNQTKIIGMDEDIINPPLDQLKI